MRESISENTLAGKTGKACRQAGLQYKVRFEMGSDKNPQKDKENPSSKSSIGSKKPTMRDIGLQDEANKKPRRIRRAGSKARAPLVKAAKFSKKEYDLFTYSDSRWGKFLGKKRSFLPKFFQ